MRKKYNRDVELIARAHERLGPDEAGCEHEGRDRHRAQKHEQDRKQVAHVGVGARAPAVAARLHVHGKNAVTSMPPTTSS